METIEIKTVVDKELNIFIVMKVFRHYVDFVVYEIIGFEEDETPLFQKKGSPTSPVFVDDIKYAEVFAHGSVKWDGCSNWHIDAQDDVMLHGCSREDLIRVGEILAKCWDLTEAYCPHWLG